MPNTEIENIKTSMENIRRTPFVIDYFNRIIRVLPSMNISSTSKKFLKLQPEFLVSGTLEGNTLVATVAGTDPETDLVTYTIPLNTISRNMANTAATSGRDFRKAGNIFRVRVSGTYTTDDAVATFSLLAKVGGSTWHTITSTGAIVTDQPWAIDCYIIIATIGASGTAESYISAKINNVNKDTSGTSTFSIDTTSANSLTVSASWTGGSAGDNVKIRQHIVELLN